jgi:hypothetical protein
MLRNVKQFNEAGFCQAAPPVSLGKTGFRHGMSAPESPAQMLDFIIRLIYEGHVMHALATLSRPLRRRLSRTVRSLAVLAEP